MGQGSLEGLLSQWAPSPDQPASSLYLRPGQLAGFLEASGAEGREWLGRLATLGPAVAESDTGLAGLRAGAMALAILPPFPVQEDRLTLAWNTSPLLALLAADYTTGVVLLRLGRFLVAVYQGRQLVSAKGGSRYVKGRHHAGGTSQSRFQRRHQGQIGQLYKAACQLVQSEFAHHDRKLDYILLGGEHLTLNGFLKACPYLQQSRGLILGRRLNIRDPKRGSLGQVAEMLRESRVYQVQW